MLVLSRKKGEQIRIGDNIVVTVQRMSGNRVSLGIEAPANCRIMRGELESLVAALNTAEESKAPAPTAREARRSRPTPNIAPTPTGENRISAHLPQALRQSK